MAKILVYTIVKKSIFVLIGTVLLSCSCEKQESELVSPVVNEPIVFPEDTISETPRVDTIPWTTYTMAQGQHDAGGAFSFRLFGGDSLHFRLTFDETIRAKTKLPANQKDWNKVLGFSDCGGHHHANSVRLVWRYDTVSELVELGRYTYVESQRSYTKVTEIQVADTAQATVYRSADEYGVVVNGIKGAVERTCSNKIASYYLFPYYGGDEPAPQDINVHIQYL